MHTQTWSVFFHRKTIELSLYHIMMTGFQCDKRYLYLIHHSCSCKKVLWNKLIIIKCNLNQTSESKSLAKHISISLYAISGYLSINLSMAKWFCQSHIWLHTNWQFTTTVYQCSLILRSLRAKPKLIEDDANGFMTALH